MYKNVFKRLFDFTLALIGLLLLSPLILFITLLLTISNSGHPFFTQTRPGKNARLFKVIKFKTMTDDRDSKGNLLPDNLRITKFGGWVRKLSIDELPQLINVLKGEMSLVGPRPLLFKYMPLYTAEQLRRHEVRPGITGWAQVNGRNSISWTQKFALDVEYVDKVSFLMDCKILLLTVKKVLIREGINQSAERPMQPFNGTN
jgi:lipopolysaccharide/colanic/teichoic acid biosynthesis glycosyltransferase